MHAGKRHVPAEVPTRLAEHLGDDELTARELDVLRLIREGSKNKEIAARLEITEATVNFHIKNLAGNHRVPEICRCLSGSINCHISAAVPPVLRCVASPLCQRTYVDRSCGVFDSQ